MTVGCNPAGLLHGRAGQGTIGPGHAAEPMPPPLSLPQGLVSMWRQAAPIVRTTLHGVLERIIMRGDVE